MHTHSDRLERWLGTEQIEQISRNMRGFHASIPLVNVPGKISVTGDGDFVGEIIGGAEADLNQKFQDVCVRERKRRLARASVVARQHGGFSSLSDLISEATTGGKMQVFNVAKAGTVGAVGVAASLWNVGAQPALGAVTGATETATTNTTVGGLAQANAASGDTLHFVSATVTATVASSTLLMADRYYYYGHTISTQSPALSTVPTRYQDTTSKGSFIHCFVSNAGALGGTPGTYQVTYMDQDGNTAEANTAQSLVAASVVNRFPFAATVGNGWFLPFNSPDVGARKLTQITQSVATGTGTLDVGLSMPICMIPLPIANIPVIIDGIQGAFNLRRVYDGSCLYFMEMPKNAATATNYNGLVTLVSG